jgi:hypothetical protein
MYIMAGQDWTMWIVGGIIAVLGYFYITSQKANGTINGDAIPVNEIESANVAHKGGCGCGV